MADELPVNSAETGNQTLPEPATAAPEASPAVESTVVAPVNGAPADEEPELEELSPEEIEEARANEVAFSWDASEYIHHNKGPGWYATLFGALAVLVLVAAILHLWIEIVAFLAMGWAILVYARKEPRVLKYELTPQGITIDGKPYLFKELRSFGVLKDIEWHTIDLEPTKRFSPRLTVLFDSDDLDSIVGHLELHLPRTDREPDIIERLSRILRF